MATIYTDGYKKCVIDCVAPYRGLRFFLAFVPHAHAWGYIAITRYAGLEKAQLFRSDGINVFWRRLL